MIILYFKNNNYYYEAINDEKIKWWCKIRHIYVYKDGTDIYDCSCFCDQHNNVIEKIELPIEEEWRWTIDGCIKGTDESVFSFMKNDLKGKCFFGEHEDGEVTILIPAEMLNIRFAGYTIDNHYLKKVYKGDQNIYFYNSVKDLHEHLYEISSMYYNVWQQVKPACLNFNANNDENLKDFIKQLSKMKELAYMYIDEFKRVHNLNVNDVAEELNEGYVIPYSEDNNE